MTALQPALFRVSSMSADAIAKVDEFQRQLLEQPQVRICTLHTLHAGVYSRTVRIPAGCAIAGVVVKISTLLIVRGSATNDLRRYRRDVGEVVDAVQRQ